MNYLKRCVATFVSLNEIQAGACSSHEETLLTISSIRQRFPTHTVSHIRISE
jgi:hypothetical protein